MANNELLWHNANLCRRQYMPYQHCWNLFVKAMEPPPSTVYQSALSNLDLVSWPLIGWAAMSHWITIACYGTWQSVMLLIEGEFNSRTVRWVAYCTWGLRNRSPSRYITVTHHNMQELYSDTQNLPQVYLQTVNLRFFITYHLIGLVATVTLYLDVENVQIWVQKYYRIVALSGTCASTQL